MYDYTTADNFSLTKPEGKWSGKGEVPTRGDTVEVTVNGIGKSIVIGYWIQYGWLGLVVMPQDPPAWYVRQNGIHAQCIVYGAEIKGE